MQSRITTTADMRKQQAALASSKLFAITQTELVREARHIASGKLVWAAATLGKGMWAVRSVPNLWQ